MPGIIYYSGLMESGRDLRKASCPLYCVGVDFKRGTLSTRMVVSKSSGLACSNP